MSSSITAHESRLADALAPRINATMVTTIDELYETIGQLIVAVRVRDRVIERLRRELNANN
jgi:hypothetical protein